MRDSKNKTGLLHFIADRITDMDTVDPVIVTIRKILFSVINHEIRLDDSCSHEEVDTGMFLHAGMWYKKFTKSL